VLVTGGGGAGRIERDISINPMPSVTETKQLSCSLLPPATNIRVAAFALPQPPVARAAASMVVQLPAVEKNWMAKCERRSTAWHVARNAVAQEGTLVDTSIINLGTSAWYFKPGAPVSDIGRAAAKIHVDTATDQTEEYIALCKLPLPGITPGMFGHGMSSFSHNLLGIGNLCNKDCKVVFTKRMVTIYNKGGKSLLTGWQESGGAKLWRTLLKPNLVSLPPLPDDPGYDPQEEGMLNAFGAYDLPSVEVLVIYFYAAAGYPVRSTWLCWDYKVHGMVASWRCHLSPLLSKLCYCLV
jgi:hypothetical protein